MTYVVAEPCFQCRLFFCADACERACFHQGGDLVVIDPDLCDDCGSCASECPAGAIYAIGELPVEWRHYAVLNALLARMWPRFASAEKDP